MGAYSIFFHFVLFSQLAMGQKRVPKRPIGKRKNIPKPAVPSGVLFDPKPGLLVVGKPPKESRFCAQNASHSGTAVS